MTLGMSLGLNARTMAPPPTEIAAMARFQNLLFNYFLIYCLTYAAGRTRRHWTCPKPYQQTSEPGQGRLDSLQHHFF
jgi:hypothetical protein